MTAKKAAAKPPPKVRIVLDQIEYPVYRFRFLFANGDTLDVEALRDDSDLRAVLLEQRKLDGDRIIGASDGEIVRWLAV